MIKTQNKLSSEGPALASYSYANAIKPVCFNASFFSQSIPTSKLTEKTFLKTIYEGKETSIVIEQNVLNPKVIITTPLENLTKTVHDLSVRFNQMQRTVDALSIGNTLIVQDSLKAIWDNNKDDFWNTF